MPARKKTSTKTTRKSSSHISEPALAKAYEGEISYETKVIITIILLLFIYPIGLIFMWWWMRNWPLWLKLVLTLPLLLGILAVFALFVFFVSIVSHMRIESRMQERRFRYMYVTPTPLVSISPNQTY